MQRRTEKRRQGRKRAASRNNKNKKAKLEKIRVRRSKGKALNSGTSRIPLTTRF